MTLRNSLPTRSRNRLLIGVVAVAIATLFSSVATASAPTDESFVASNAPGGGYLGINASPNFLNTFTNPFLIGKVLDGSGQVTQAIACKGASDPACSKATLWQGNSLWDFCKSDADTNCIVAVKANKSGVDLPVTLGDSFPSVRSQDFAGDPASHLPPGGQTHLVSIPGAPHASGDQYLVVSNGTVERHPGQTLFDNQIALSIYAVHVVSGSYQVITHSTNAADYAGWAEAGVGGGADTSNYCIMNDFTQCAIPEALPMDVTFDVQLRVNFPVINWFSGRMQSPNIVLTDLGNGNTLLDIAASPTRVPAVFGYAKKSDLPSNLQQFYAGLPFPLGGQMAFSNGGGSFAQIEKGDPNSWSLLRDLTSYDQQTMDEFVMWLPLIHDSADAMQTLWTFRTMNGNGNNSCLQSNSSLGGIVSTNATMYIEGPPTFDNQTQTLDYKVAAPHFEKDGSTPFIGSYDLAIRSDVARCLYHFTSAPVKASVSIVSDSGQNEVAATTLTEHDGFIYLSAEGFEFSNPVIQVKLFQDPVATPTASPTPSPAVVPTATQSPASASKVSKKPTYITCINVQTHKLKTFISTPAGCPNHYKLKK